MKLVDYRPSLLDYRMKAALQAAGCDLLDTLKIWATVAAIAAIVFAIIVGFVALAANLGASAVIIAFAILCAIATAVYSGVQAYHRGW